MARHESNRAILGRGTSLLHPRWPCPLFHWATCLYAPLHASRRRRVDPRTLGLRMLREDLCYLLEQYRPLDHDYPSRVRYPRFSESWPSFDQQWDYVAARLYSLNELAGWTIQKARRVWQDNNWQENEFRLFSATEMVNILVGLQECIDCGFRRSRSLIPN